jgi:hypothetical protein
MRSNESDSHSHSLTPALLRSVPDLSLPDAIYRHAVMRMGDEPRKALV